MSSSVQDLTKDSILLSSITAKAVREVLEIVEIAAVDNNIKIETTDDKYCTKCVLNFSAAASKRGCNDCLLPGDDVLLCFAFKRYKGIDTSYRFISGYNSNIDSFSRTVSTASKKAYWDVESAKKAIENMRFAHV